MNTLISRPDTLFAKNLCEQILQFVALSLFVVLLHPIPESSRMSIWPDAVAAKDSGRIHSCASPSPPFIAFCLTTLLLMLLPLEPLLLQPHLLQFVLVGVLIPQRNTPKRALLLSCMSPSLSLFHFLRLASKFQHTPPILHPAPRWGSRSR